MKNGSGNNSVPIIEVRDLIKHYPKTKAVNGVSFSIPAGKCFGLLGPNGAGKTTTIEMIEGITTPTSGGIFYRGALIGKEFRENSGIQFQSTSLQDYLKVREALELFSKFYKKTLPLDYLAKLCSLEEFWEQETDKLSGGQMQRLLLAIALVNDPDVVFLDEPTTGLDPQARRSFWELIQTIKKKNKTIILTTHYMEEAYLLCDEIIIMDRGTIIAQGPPDRLLKQHFDGVTLELPKNDFKISSEPPAGLWKTNSRNEMIEIYTSQVTEALRFLINSGASLNHLKIRSQTLEDLFLELTGRDLRS
jgi:ABC-2 type transport system ATP-binding protein